MSDKLLSEAENAYVAFKDYRYALEDPEWEHPRVALWNLEEAIRKLGDAIDDATADAMPDNTAALQQFEALDKALKELNDE